VSDWNRATFRTGQAADYGILNEGEPQEEAQRGRTEGDQEGDGRGDAILDRSPKPTPGDELYDTIHRSARETTERGQSQDGYLSAIEFAALMDLTMSDQTRAEDQAAPAWQQEQAQQDQTQQQDQQRGGFAQMRADQAGAEIEQPRPQGLAPEQEQSAPDGLMGSFVQKDAAQGQEQDQSQRDGLMSAFVENETYATAVAERGQDMQRQRSRSMDLAM
jgi:hypothetical protein